MKFTTKIKRSLTFITVTVRKWQGVNANDQVGFIRQGVEVTGEIFFIDNPTLDIWMKLEGGQYNGYWIALSYNGKIFADQLPTRENIPVPPVETVPGDKLLAYVLPNRLLKPPFYKFKGGNIPDTRGGIEARTVKQMGRAVLTEKIQDMIFYDNFERAYGMKFKDADQWYQAHAINEFVYLLGYKLAFVNDAGAQTRKVPIANLNMKAKFPEANQILFPGIIELKETKTYTIHKKTNQIPFYTLNALHPHIEDFTSIKYPFLWKRPVIIKWAQLNGGVEGSEPFDQFRARLRWPGPMMNGTDTGFIDKRLIRILKPGDPMPTWFTKDWGA